MNIWLRRTLVTVFAVPLCTVLIGVLLFTAWLHGWRIPLASGSTWFSVTKTGEAHFNNEPTQPLFFLVVGNDERPGLGGARGDALHLIGVNPASKQATIIDIPRDTMAAIPGHGRNKINAANAFGGAKLTAATVGSLVGVNVPYVLECNFAGFTGMVDEIGGVDVNVPTGMNDHYSGAVLSAGPNHLNGQQALAFSRDRHDFPTGDLKRSENQGLFIISALGTLRAQNPGTVGTFRLLGILGRHAKLEGVGIKDLYSLGRLGLSIDPTQIRNVVVPSGGNGSVLPAAQSLFADFRDDGVLQSH